MDTNESKEIPEKEEGVSRSRRTLVAFTGLAGAVAGVAVATPFLMSMAPSERARAAGAPVEVDLSKLEPGMLITEEWRGKPVWILHRTEDMLAKLKDTDLKIMLGRSSLSISFWSVFVRISDVRRVKSSNLVNLQD